MAGKTRVYLKDPFAICVFVCAVLMLPLLLPRSTFAEEIDIKTARGMQLIVEGKHEEALEMFRAVLDEQPGDSEALFYAGVACAKLGRFQEAESYLLRSSPGASPPAEVLFELGRLYFMSGRCEEAEVRLSRFVSISQDAPAKDFAARMMTECGEEEGRDTQRATLTYGAQHDSNVIIEPEVPVADREGSKSDLRAVISFAAAADVYKRGPVRLGLGYRLYASGHSRLDDFDVTHHKVSPELKFRLGRRLRALLGYSYEHTFMGGATYSRHHSARGALTLKENEFTSTELLYEYRDERYMDSTANPLSTNRNGHRQSVGLKQTWAAGNFAGEVYGFGDFRSAREEYWSYVGFRAGVKAIYRVVAPLFFTVGVEYAPSDYREDFPAAAESRSDHTTQYTAGLVWRVHQQVSVTLNDTFVSNNSNLDPFEYRRNIAGLFVTFSLN